MVPMLGARGRVVKNVFGEEHVFLLTQVPWAEPNGSIYWQLHLSQEILNAQGDQSHCSTISKTCLKKVSLCLIALSILLLHTGTIRLWYYYLHVCIYWSKVVQNCLVGIEQFSKSITVQWVQNNLVGLEQFNGFRIVQWILNTLGGLEHFRGFRKVQWIYK